MFSNTRESGVSLILWKCLHSLAKTSSNFPLSSNLFSQIPLREWHNLHDIKDAMFSIPTFREYGDCNNLFCSFRIRHSTIRNQFFFSSNKSYYDFSFPFKQLQNHLFITCLFLINFVKSSKSIIHKCGIARPSSTYSIECYNKLYIAESLVTSNHFQFTYTKSKIYTHIRENAFD